MSWNHKYRIKLVLLVTLMLGMLGIIMFNFTPSSRAMSENEYRDYVGYLHGEWLAGTFLAAKTSERVVCIQSGNDAPDYLSESNKYLEDAISAYALWKYGNTRDDATAAGLWWLLQDRQAMDSVINKWSGYKGLEKVKSKLTNSERESALAKRDEILAEAKKFSGPYQAKLSFNSADRWKSKGKIIASVASKAGNQVPGLLGKITLINAVFTDGSKNKSFQSGSGKDEFEYQAIANGEVKAEVVYETAATAIKINQPDEIGQKRAWQNLVLAAGSNSKVSATAVSTVKLTWDPRLTTKVENRYLQSGGEIKDQVEAIGGKPNTKFSGKFYFYGVNEDPTKNPRPKGIKAFAEVPYEAIFDEQGKAKFTVSAKIPEDLTAKFFTVVGTIASDSKTGIKGFEANWGEVTESGVILNPELKSKVAHTEVNVNEEVSDTWWIYQVPSELLGEKLNIELRSRVLGPLIKENGKCPVGEAAWAKAPVAMESDFYKLELGKNIKFGEKGELEVVAGSFKPDKGGSCYSFAGDLRIKDSDKIVAEFSHKLGEAEQGFYVPLEKINTGQGVKNHAAFLGAGILLIGGIGSRVMRRSKPGKRYKY